MPTKSLLRSLGSHEEARVLGDISRQYEHNRGKWGHYQRTPAEHLVIAMEEIGEVARAMQGDGDVYRWPPQYDERVYEELIDASAVLYAMALDVRNAVRAKSEQGCGRGWPS